MALIVQLNKDRFFAASLSCLAAATHHMYILDPKLYSPFGLLIHTFFKNFTIITNRGWNKNRFFVKRFFKNKISLHIRYFV